MPEPCALNAYMCLQDILDFNDQNGASILVPEPVAGVAAVMVEFGQLQHISERESVPAFFLSPDSGHLRTPIPARLNEYINALQANEQPAINIWDARMYKACPDTVLLTRKIDHLHIVYMLQNVVEIMRANFTD